MLSSGLIGNLPKRKTSWHSQPLPQQAPDAHIEAAKSIIEEWLQLRGLTLHPETTRIVHINDGFNFLGFSVKRYRGKCLIKPQKEKVLAFLAKLRSWLSKHKQAKAENVIRHFNPILRGWTNYYKTQVSGKVFSYVSSEIWKMLWQWCLRRHPTKGKHWVADKYFGFHENERWKFQASSGDKTLRLLDVGSVKIERHTKVKGSASPDDPTLQDYWLRRHAKRKARLRMSRVTKTQPQLGRRREPYDGKLSRTVLKGAGHGDMPSST